MKLQPLVSVIIPAYNAENTIIETLECVARQTYSDIETIVVNDGSTDRTSSIIEQFIIDKPHFSLYSKHNEGLAATRNYGFQFVKGEYLLFLDADDLIDLNFVKLCVDEFQTGNNIDIVATQVQHFERENDIYVFPKFSLDTILKVNCFTITSMIKSKAFKDIGMFDVTMKFHEDWEMWIRMTEKYNNVVRIDQPLFWYRKRNAHDSMCDLNFNDNVANEMHLYIYQKHFYRYLQAGYSLERLFETIRREELLRKKYYGVWYRKLFYRLRKTKR
ncbi:glycosyltransferase family 2 protein [Sphingobacterium pedocola]|uniref:Glycosyltransferase 2-like domain-containing protein n=1 Tax=Sphingobacterium pedocola TaxID=2082722 RepID=A0ABR9TAG2_9SPHI|nr:glycosyltransferase family A protein [Sphingobacterium pedocola]MBE8722315.1 hypothetical protein [Sphingobacterium pedocola]